MSDPSGRQPEERLPAPRPPSEPVPASRLSAPPAIHRYNLTPERAARIVRQSANARWMGFLAVTMVALFIIGYYFYEVGLPGGLSTPRMDAAAQRQQVTAVQMGYNIYQANCAQCHGVNGEGGKGPILNDQVKLFAHLNPAYIRNMLVSGGRYACGNANSIMPVWADTGNPPGPLNYIQINNLISFLRASKADTYVELDPLLTEPVVKDGKEQTFTGWVDPNYSPAPGATPFPACWLDSFKTPAPSSAPTAAPSAGASAAPSAGASVAPPASTAIDVTALNIAFVQTALTAPADAPFTIHFDNQDQGIPHDIQIKDASGNVMFSGDLVTGPAKADYQVPALKAGDYTFVCTVHPNMTGTLKAGS